MKFILCMVFLLLAQISFAQVDPVADYNKHIASNWNGEFVRIGPYRVKGTPNLYGQSLLGGVTFKEDKKLAFNMIFFDIYQQKIGGDVNGFFTEINAEVENFFISAPKHYGGKKMFFKPTSHFGNSDLKGFFEILTEGPKISFLKYFKATVVPDPVNQMDKEARMFEQLYEYYIYNNTSKKLIKIKLKEKDVLKALESEKGNLIPSKLDFSNETEVVNIVNQINNK